MRSLILTALMALVMGAQAQSQPRYYTDSDVRQRVVNFNVYGQPGTVFRRIGADLNGVQPEVTDKFLSRLMGETGFSADFNLRPLYLGVGVGQTWVNYGHRLENGDAGGKGALLGDSHACRLGNALERRGDPGSLADRHVPKGHFL